MTDPHDLDARRAAVASLGSAMREATVALAASEVAPDELLRAAELARQITAIVGAERRQLSEIPSVDDLAHGIRYFSPTIGLGNPMAPPIEVESTAEGVRVLTTLDRRFEGPPGFVHGGMTGLLLDEILGQAGTRIGRWGMTAYLNITYRRALPIDVELELTALVTGTEGRKTFVSGTIAVATDPTVAYVEATALFIEPRAERQADYFAHLTDVDGTPKSARHGSPGIG